MSCDVSAASGGSYWYHTLWSTCGTTLCTAEIDAATGCAGDKAYMRHGDDGCGCGSGVVCACGDGSVAGRGVGAPLHAHYVRGCAWECDGGFERDATGNACIESSPPPPEKSTKVLRISYRVSKAVNIILKSSVFHWIFI